MRLHVQEWGEPAGEPVVCVHGISSSGLHFTRLARDRLADRRVVAVDLRGHGRSGAEPPWRLETHVADVLETADALGIERADWVGHSFGGRVVWEIAAARPERVGRLVLLDAAIRAVEPADALERALWRCEDESYASPEEAAESWRATLARAPAGLVREAAEEALDRGRDGRWRWRFCPSAVIAALGELTLGPAPAPPVPTLSVVGADSRVARAPVANEVVVPGGHQVLLDALPETGAAVASFLASVVAA